LPLIAQLSLDCRSQLDLDGLSRNQARLAAARASEGTLERVALPWAVATIAQRTLVLVQAIRALRTAVVTASTMQNMKETVATAQTEVTEVI
jgi:hypothetical protein